MQFTTMDEVIAEAMTVVGDGTDTERIKSIARQWIWTAVKDLPVVEDMIKVCEVKVKNLTIAKPKDMRTFLEIALFDTNDVMRPHEFHMGNKRIYPQILPWNLWWIPDAQVPENCGPIDISETEYAFILGSNGEHVDYAKVRYFSWPVDKNGEVLLRQEDTLMCVYYIRYMASLKRNENRSEIDQNFQLWANEHDRLRAKYKRMKQSTEYNKTLGEIMNRMIPSFRRNYY